MPRLTVEDVELLRGISMPIPSGIAPFTSSEFFKSPRAKMKPTSRTLDHHLSFESRHFGGSQLKKSAALEGSRNLIRMGVGRPNAELYPWNLTAFELSPSAKVIETSESRYIFREGHSFDVATALNYGNAVGSPHLIRFLTEHTEIVHDPSYSDWNVCLTCGSTSSLETTLRIFCNTGDTVLSEEFTYPGFSEVAALVGVNVQGVIMDVDGLCSNTLDELLDAWDYSTRRKPRVLYMIPTGQNPTGCTQSRNRRKAIYEVAEKHDLVIVEDDPYYFLSLKPLADTVKANGTTNNPENEGRSTDYCSSLLPSYFSIDRSGRVVRLDSVSKFLCPGLRAGWVTASCAIIDKFIAYNEVNSITASGPSQLMLYRLFEQSWGHRGLFSWLENLSQVYRRRRNVVELALKRYLPLELCRWSSPQYGMFLWLRLDLKEHPYFQCQGSREQILPSTASEIERRILADAIENGVEFTKGSMFTTNDDIRGEVYIRMTYAAAVESDLEEGVRVVANSIRREFNIFESLSEIN